MTVAISSTCAPRPSRVVWARPPISSDFSGTLNTGPGATVLTRTPWGLNSAAHAVGQRRQGGLGRAVGGATGQTDGAGHARHVDDAAPAFLSHGGGQRSDQEIGGADVAVEEHVELGLVQLRGGAEPRTPGVVHEHVDVARLFSEAPCSRHLRQVGLHEASPSSPGLDLGHDLATTSGMAAVNDNVPALVRQSHGRRSSDA